MSITLQDVEGARDRLTDPDVVRRTPVETSRSISRRAGAPVYLKMEHLQRTGSFKTRGAYNKLQTLDAGGSIDRVVAASAGNHAQGVALAATRTGIDATIVMPEHTPQAKVNATRSYGADVEIVGTGFQEAMGHAKGIADEHGWPLIHAYDDPEIMAGQGTIALEILEDVPDVETVVVPIGGGGLIAGIAATLAEAAPEVAVIGVQAEGAATVPQSLEEGEPVSIDDPRTIADGIATGGISEHAFGIIRSHVDRVVTVTDDEIARSILVLLERAKQLVEGAGAVSVAAVCADELDIGDGPIVTVLTGGNIDIARLQTVLTHALVDRSQLLQLKVRIEDQPGQMEEIAGAIAARGANIRTVRHERAVEGLQVGEAYLIFRIVTGGSRHAEGVIDAIADRGYDVTRIR